MEIRRDEYLARLIARKHNGFIKVITGIRRCGKSYLMNNLFYEHLLSCNIEKSHIIRFAFDSASDLLKIGENPIVLDNSKEDRKVDPEKFLSWLMPQITEDGMYYLLLDEVQKLGAFESVLNGFLRKENLDVYVSGSNSKFLSKDILTEFVGRGDEVHVMPLSFSEYYSFKGGDKSETYDEYSVYGGLPAVALMNTEEQKASYLSTQFQNVYIRDIVRRYSIKEDSSLSEVIDVIASGISTLTNPKRIANTMNTIHKNNVCEATVDRYIGYAEDAFLLKRVKRFNVKGRKYIGTPYKIYFEDIGLRNARLSFRQIEETHIMENIIYNELRFRGFLVDVGIVESKENNDRNYYEIDFVCTQGNRKYYIQSAYDIPNGEKYNQEIKGLEKINDNFKKVIIVNKSMKPRYNENGYLFMGVKEFLLDKDSLDY